MTQYDYDKTQGYQPLSLSKDPEQTFSLGEIPKLIASCLEQAAGPTYLVNDPTLEIFLPLNHLDEAVEDWSLLDENPEDNPFADTEAEPDKLGWRYRVVLRSTDRSSYRFEQKKRVYVADWKQRWQNLETVVQSGKLACDCMVDAYDPEEELPLIQRITPLEVLGVKLCPKAGFQDLKTALNKSLPIAVWVRHPIPNAKSLLNKFLARCFLQVPSEARSRRSKARNPKTDLGCHLGLLWDNPFLRPPKPKTPR